MDAITSFFESIKERFNNPLIFSFSVAWVLHNWPITIGLFWLESPSHIPAHEYFCDYVSMHLNFFDCFLIPFLWSLGYTFGMPYVKMWISNYSSRIGKTAHEREIEIWNKGKIDIDQVLTLQNNYNERMRQIEEAYNNLKQTSETLMKTQGELNGVKNDFAHSTNKVANLQSLISNLHNLNHVTGRWILHSNHPMEKKVILEFIGEVVYKIDGMNKPEYAAVKGFTFNRDTKRVTFNLLKNDAGYTHSGDNSGYLTYFYDLMFEHNEMIGTEYTVSSVISVKFVRPESVVVDGGTL